MHDIVFLFDVDNTLLDNDRIQADLRAHIAEILSPEAAATYWALFEALRDRVGYADYLGALQLYRERDPHDPRVMRIGCWLTDYPFAERLYPGALGAVRNASAHGATVIVSDGDAVFQPRKIGRSGLWRAFETRALIYIHKETELADIERCFPARRYVLIDDKVRILDAVKRQWGARVRTVFPRQGHYAHDTAEVARHPAPDMMVETIGELAGVDWTALLGGDRERP